MHDLPAQGPDNPVIKFLFMHKYPQCGSNATVSEGSADPFAGGRRHCQRQVSDRRVSSDTSSDCRRVPVLRMTPTS